MNSWAESRGTKISLKHRVWKRRFPILTTGILLAAVAWLVVANHESTPMPVYQGKTARQWYGMWNTNAVGAMDAFKKMGSNAAPFLIHEMAKKDTILDKLWQWSYPKLPSGMSKHFVIPKKESERLEENHFTLIAMRYRDGIPPLLQVLAKGNDDQRLFALGVLQFLAESSDTDCIPPLTTCLKAKDRRVCFAAAQVLGKMIYGNLAVPALTNYLSSKDPEVRIECLRILEHVDPGLSAKWDRMRREEEAAQNSGLTFPQTRTVSNSSPMSSKKEN